MYLLSCLSLQSQSSLFFTILSLSTLALLLFLSYLSLFPISISPIYISCPFHFNLSTILFLSSLTSFLPPSSLSLDYPVSTWLSLLPVSIFLSLSYPVSIPSIFPSCLNLPVSILALSLSPLSSLPISQLQDRDEWECISYQIGTFTTWFRIFYSKFQLFPFPSYLSQVFSSPSSPPPPTVAAAKR